MTPREYFEFVGAVRDIPEEQLTDRIEMWARRLGLIGSCVPIFGRVADVGDRESQHETVPMVRR